MNPIEALERERGIYLIQGSLSLDDEDMDNCTEILPGLHLKLEEWVQRARARGANIGTAVLR